MVDDIDGNAGVPELLFELFDDLGWRNSAMEERRRVGLGGTGLSGGEPSFAMLATLDYVDGVQRWLRTDGNQGKRSYSKELWCDPRRDDKGVTGMGPSIQLDRAAGGSTGLGGWKWWRMYQWKGDH